MPKPPPRAPLRVAQVGPRRAAGGAVALPVDAPGPGEPQGGAGEEEGAGGAGCLRSLAAADEVTRCGGCQCCGCVWNCTCGECVAQLYFGGPILVFLGIGVGFFAGFLLMLVLSALVGAWGNLAASAVFLLCWWCKLTLVPYSEELDGDEKAVRGYRRLVSDSWLVLCVARCAGWDAPDQLNPPDGWVPRGGNALNLNPLLAMQHLPCTSCCVFPILRPLVFALLAAPASFFLYACSLSLVLDTSPGAAKHGEDLPEYLNSTPPRLLAIINTCAYATLIFSLLAIIMGPLAARVHTQTFFLHHGEKGRDGRVETAPRWEAYWVLPACVLLELFSWWVLMAESSLSNSIPHTLSDGAAAAIVLVPRFALGYCIVCVAVPICTPGDREFGVHNARCLTCCGCCCCPAACRRRCFPPGVLPLLERYACANDCNREPVMPCLACCFYLCLAFGMSILPSCYVGIGLVAGAAEASQVGRTADSRALGAMAAATALLVYLLPSATILFLVGWENATPFAQAGFVSLAAVTAAIVTLGALLWHPAFASRWRDRVGADPNAFKVPP